MGWVQRPTPRTVTGYVAYDYYDNDDHNPSVMIFHNHDKRYREANRYNEWGWKFYESIAGGVIFEEYEFPDTCETLEQKQAWCVAMLRTR